MAAQGPQCGAFSAARIGAACALARTRWRRAALFLLAALLCLLQPARGAPAHKWRQRSVYQLLTDRFAGTQDGDLQTTCDNYTLSNAYCGGNMQGILNKLGYIKGLNVDAVWPSPITTNIYGGYHGYWPANMYDTNPLFATPDGLATYLEEMNEAGIYNMIDVVANHVGYGVADNWGSPYNPFPVYNTSLFSSCKGCGENCSIPNGVATVEQNYYCRLGGLPDLNQTNPYVAQQLNEWVSWLTTTFPNIDGLRMDAMGHVPPAFWAPFMRAAGVFGLGEVWQNPLLLYVKALQEVRPKGGGDGDYSFLNFDFAFAVRNCFALETGDNGVPDTPDCSYISTLRQAWLDLEIDLTITGYFIENHDLPRFLSVRNSYTALRNALAVMALGEGIPIYYYGTEQGMVGANVLLSSLNRQPLWEFGYDVGNPLYVFIRMVNWLRYWMKLASHDFIEVYVDKTTYAFQRGTDLVVVATNGLGNASTYTLSRLAPSNTWCNMADHSVCFESNASGFADVDADPAGEPMIFVSPATKNLKEYPGFFVPVEARPIAWRTGLIATFATLVGAMLLGYALFYAAPALLKTSRGERAAAVRRLLGLTARFPVDALSKLSRSPGAAKSNSLNGISSTTMALGSAAGDIEAGARAAAGAPPPAPPAPAAPTAAGGVVLKSPFLQPLPEGAPPAGWGAAGGAAPAALPPTSPRPPLPGGIARTSVGEGSTPLGPRLSRARSSMPRSLLLTHEALSLPNVHSAHPMLAQLASLLSARPQTVMHVALEYSVPHLGHETDLMFGGLGKVVDMFIRHRTRPILVCAPLYEPFYDEQGGLLGADFAHGPITALVARVGTAAHLVSVYLTADMGPGAAPDAHSAADSLASAAARSGAGASAAGQGGGPSFDGKVPGAAFYLLLEADIFRGRTRGTIYNHADEDEEMTFFSVYNQAVAHVVSLLRVRAIQGHDYHGLLSLKYLPPAERPAVLYTAHNADYNGRWKLGSRARERHVYSMMNIPLNDHTRSICEHEGRFNMLRTVIWHLKKRQGGTGMVGVSPRYADRAYRKFSMFWLLPPDKVTGILNGMDEEERAFAVPQDMDAFFEAKGTAKIAFQRRAGLEEGVHKRLMVFLGRVTHQKGCDLIAGAADNILNRCPDAQIVVVGPIGDEWGQAAAAALERAAARHPGRLWNGAGQYVRGAQKDELIMGTDFFLCPSRFEPCGLADIEFGWAGAVMVGHNTGGLGKMPGFYFEAELDNTEDLTGKLERVALRALAASPETLRALGEEAIAKTFPPAQCVELYSQIWRKILLHSHITITAKDAKGRMKADEAAFYKDAWLEDNRPYDAQAMEGKAGAALQQSKRNRFRQAVITNLMLILLQGLLHAPSVFALTWYTVSSQAGNIWFAGQAADTAIASSSPLAIYFYIYAGSACVWQTVGFVMRPSHFIVLAAYGNIGALLLTLWSFVIPTATAALYIITACLSAIWVPVTPFVFLDIESRVSVSQHGPALMGFSTFWQYISIVIVFLVPAVTGSSVDYSGYLAGTVVLLILGVLYVMWLSKPGTLPPVFRHYRLRLRGALPTLLRRRCTWGWATATTTLDSFSLTFLLGAVYDSEGIQTLHIFLVAFLFTGMLLVMAASWVMSTMGGQLAGLRLMYGAALLPGIAFAQMACVIWGGFAGSMVAATVLQLGFLRTAIPGILTLHTLPTRETQALVQLLQIVLGSLALAAGGIAATTVLNRAVYVYITIGAEALRLILVAALVRNHQRENTATP